MVLAVQRYVGDDRNQHTNRLQVARTFGFSSWPPLLMLLMLLVPWFIACGARTGLTVDENLEDAGVDARDVGIDERVGILTDGGTDATIFPPRCVQVPRQGAFIDIEQRIRIQSADVLLLVDATRSMASEIVQIRRTLASVIMPGLLDTIPNVQLSVARFADFPVEPFGIEGDQPYRLLQTGTRNVSRLRSAVSSIVAQGGNDAAESQVYALWRVLNRGSESRCAAATEGDPCFRPGSARIVLMFTDAPFHNGPCFRWQCPSAFSPYDDTVEPVVGYDVMVDQLQDQGVKVLPLFSRSDTGDEFLFAVSDFHLSRLALDTGAIRSNGRPIVQRIGSEGEGLGEGVVQAVRTLVSESPFRVDLLLEDILGDTIDARDLVQRVEALSVVPANAAQLAGDHFEQAVPGSTLRFRLWLTGEGADVRPGQRIPLRVIMRADGVSELAVYEIQLVLPESGLVCP